MIRSMGRSTLGRALASVAAQDVEEVEIVVVLASGREHPPLQHRFGALPITQVATQAPLPRAAAADAGIRAAHGRWITFLDDDDEFLPGHLAGLSASAAAAPERARAVTGRALATFSDGRTEVWGQRFAVAELYRRNFIHLSTLLFHRSLLDAGIAFDHALELHEDWDFALQLAQHTQFADWPQPTFRWYADVGASGGGGGGNVDDAACAAQRDVVYRKWAPVRDAWLERCIEGMHRAAAHAAAGRLGEAESAARAILAFSQNDPHALNLLAMLAARQGRLRDALDFQSLAVEVSPHDADLRFNLANVHLARADRRAALSALEATLALDSAHAGAVARLRELNALPTPV
ncbi:MAG: glycosyltransferase [Betaproteobacteria bacterium]